MTPPRPRSRSAAALALSALLHLALVAVLLWPRPAPPPPPIEVALLPWPSPAPERIAPASAIQESPAPAPAIRAASPRAGAERRSTPTAGTGAGGEPERLAGRVDRGSSEWLEAEGLGLAAPRLPPGASLTPSPWLAGQGPGQATDRDAPARDPSLPEEPEVAGRRAKARVDAMLGELVAVERAEHPDRYWSEVRDRLGHGFAADWGVLERGGHERLPAGVRSVSRALRSYGEALARYGASGNPRAGDQDAPGSRRSLQDDVRDLDVGAALSPAMRGLTGAQPEDTLFHTRLVTLVMLTQAEDGAVVSFELLQGSGNGEHDRLALDRASSLSLDPALQLGVPPRDRRRTLWAFETDFDLTPPVPMVMCGFDAYFQPAGCNWPLKRTVRSRVRLRAIY